jgi:hypothetical protein
MLLTKIMGGVNKKTYFICVYPPLKNIFAPNNSYLSVKNLKNAKF